MSVRKRPDLGGNFEAFAKIDAALQRYTKALNAQAGVPCGAVVDRNELWGWAIVSVVLKQRKRAFNLGVKDSR